MLRSAPWTAALAAAALLLGAGAARADDETAKRHWRRARAHWRDDDPSTCAKYLEMAIEAADTPQLRLTMYLIHGQFHQAKTGDFTKARQSYAKIVKAIDDETTDPRLLRLKSGALLGQGTITYTETHDAAKALPLFKQSFALLPTPMSADTLSQLYMRMGRAASTPAAERPKHMQDALKMARKALDLDLKRKRRRPQWTTKLRLQLVIVLTALGKADEAKQESGQIEEAYLSANTLYQEALLMALRKRPPGDVGAKLREALSEKLRPGVRARNQIRGFIRTEPDFQAFLKRDDWKDLVTDEPLPKPKPEPKEPEPGQPEPPSNGQPKK